MAMNDKSVFTSVRGAAFLADANTALPSLKLFSWRRRPLARPPRSIRTWVI